MQGSRWKHGLGFSYEVYVFGGIRSPGEEGDEIFQDKAEKYDIKNDKWELISDPPYSLGITTCTACGNVIYITSSRIENQFLWYSKQMNNYDYTTLTVNLPLGRPRALFYIGYKFWIQDYEKGLEGSLTTDAANEEIEGSGCAYDDWVIGQPVACDNLVYYLLISGDIVTFNSETKATSIAGKVLDDDV